MPLSILCPGCGTGFGVETELAGRNLRCPACQSVFKAPNLSRESSTTGGLTSVFDRDQFFINQKMLSLIERYTLLDANGAPLIHVERPAHYMKSCASIFVLVISIIAAAIAGGIAGFTTRGALGAARAARARGVLPGLVGRGRGGVAGRFLCSGYCHDYWNCLHSHDLSQTPHQYVF